MVRNVVAILLFVVAGFGVLEAQVIASLNLGHAGLGLAMVGGFSVFAVAVLAVGVFAGTFQPRMRAAGIVLIATSAFAAFGAFSIATIALSPQMMEHMQPSGTPFLSSMFQVTPGVLAIALTALIGAALLRLSRTRT